MRSWVQSLPHSVGNALLMARRFRTSFFEDGLFTVISSDFSREPRFKRAYAKAKETGSFANWEVRWRIHVLTWAAELAARVDGDFVECGTDHGGTAMAIIDWLDFERTGKKFWLCDTFQGIDRSLTTTGEDKGFLDYSDCYQRVRETFSSMPFVRIVRGSVPSTLPEVKAQKVAFLHLDMNATVPEIAALEHFWPKMERGGVAIFDDYGWPRHKVQKAGFDKFAAERGLSILQLPTGQGMIVKA